MCKENVDIVAQAIDALVRGDLAAASKEIANGYPFKPPVVSRRSWTQRRALGVFVRDGFIDRYSGGRLLFPGALRVLSLLIPDEFPAHANWKMSETHTAYWELFPTLDHVVPIGRGGPDTDENLVTTSMLRNQAKSSWTLEELGWRLYPQGSLQAWDGLLSTTIALLELRPELLEDRYLRGWHNAAVAIEPRKKR